MSLIMSVYHKADPGELIQWDTRVTVERGIKFGIDQNRDAAANCWRLAPVTHAGRAASSPEIFRQFLTVCLTVFPFEFRPRTFTIGFNGKKSFISELMILEFSFPLIENRRHGLSFSRRESTDTGKPREVKHVHFLRSFLEKGRKTFIELFFRQTLFFYRSLLEYHSCSPSFYFFFHSFFAYLLEPVWGE